MDLNPTEVLKALRLAEGDVSHDGVNREYPAVLVDAVRYLSKAWQQTSMTDTEIDETSALTVAVVEATMSDRPTNEVLPVLREAKDALCDLETGAAIPIGHIDDLTAKMEDTDE